MHKKNNRVNYLDLSDKKGVSLSGSKSGAPLKLSSSEFIYKDHDNKKLDPVYLDDDSTKDEEGAANNYWYRGELMKLVQDPFEELLNAREIVVEQKIELMEVLGGCETPNRYNVFLIDKNKLKKFLFKCKEESNWWCRNFCPSSSREVHLKMIHIYSNNKAGNYKQAIAEFDKPFQCAFFCCYRPTMDGFVKPPPVMENGVVQPSAQIKKERLGKLIETINCNPEIIVYGPNNQVRWKIYGDYCQCGFFARDLSIGKCYEVDFWIYDANADVKKARPVGNIHKVFRGLSELVTDADAFVLTLPKKATAIERLMLIGAVINMDYRFYEEISWCECLSII